MVLKKNVPKNEMIYQDYLPKIDTKYSLFVIQLSFKRIVPVMAQCSHRHPGHKIFLLFHLHFFILFLVFKEKSASGFISGKESITNRKSCFGNVIFIRLLYL